MNNESTNILTLDKNGLVNMLVYVNALRLSGVDLGIEKDFMISGYSVNDWITDIKAKLAIIAIKDEQKKLQILEDKLHVLLSSDKKVELEIETIEKLLN